MRILPVGSERDMAGLESMLYRNNYLMLLPCVDNIERLPIEVVKQKPNLVILSYEMGQGDLSLQLNQLKERFPDLKVLVMVGDLTVNARLRIVSAPIDGLLSKENSAFELVHALAEISDGYRYIPNTLNTAKSSSDLPDNWGGQRQYA